MSKVIVVIGKRSRVAEKVIVDGHVLPEVKEIKSFQAYEGDARSVTVTLRPKELTTLLDDDPRVIAILDAARRIPR